LPSIDFSINVVAPADTVRWPANVEHAAFMVAREAVENALRHSGSPTVQVHLAGDADVLELEITDEGTGMLAEANGHGSHLGILGMHERVRAIGATVTVRANKPRGTHVHLHWQAAP
jgi:signal transduction histidine kinase